jgi:predicted HicB family RNase H-like nuclease
MKNTLDDIKIRVPKGKREEYKAFADRRGMSLNAYVISLIEKDMEQD